MTRIWRSKMRGVSLACIAALSALPALSCAATDTAPAPDANAVDISALMRDLTLTHDADGRMTVTMWMPDVFWRNAIQNKAGSNSVSGLKITQAKNGVWTADFDYFYTGDPRFASLAVELTPQPGAPLGPNGIEQYQTFLQQPQRGAHHESVAIRYPGGELRTLKVTVTMRKEMFSPVVVANQSVDKVIDWPDFQTFFRNQQLAMATPEQNFNRAVALIDTEGGAQMIEARSILEGLIAENPKFDAGYVELARVAMKTNWGPEGLHQAETLLQSALQIQPNNINAKILLGYVYSHEKHYAKAEALFNEAAAAKSNNLWLWANWGELLATEGKTDQAILKYRSAPKLR